MNILVRPLGALRNAVAEAKAACGLAADLRSKAQLVCDFFLFRVLKLVPLLSNGAYERTVKLRDGTQVTYRLNRGDIQSIREIFLDTAYRLPFDCKVSFIVDLGANIGLTSVWLAKTYGASRVIAVEPDPANARFLRKNLDDNRVRATVVEAAIGAHDGIAHFADSIESNLGKVAPTGRAVRMVTMGTLLADIDETVAVDILKMDIEGGEQDLLTGDLTWLKRVNGIIAEFHPEVVDYSGLTKILEDVGFTYFPHNSVFAKNMDAFVRNAELVNTSGPV